MSKQTKKQVLYRSRRSANLIKSLPESRREEHIKRFIASYHADRLMPYINITHCDDDFREIQYEIALPESIRKEDNHG